MFSSPVVTVSNTSIPIAVFLSPVVRLFRAFVPIPTLYAALLVPLGVDPIKYELFSIFTSDRSSNSETLPEADIVPLEMVIPLPAVRASCFPSSCVCIAEVTPST